jgi:hypothetical protein
MPKHFVTTYTAGGWSLVASDADSLVESHIRLHAEPPEFFQDTRFLRPCRKGGVGFRIRGIFSALQSMWIRVKANRKTEQIQRVQHFGERMMMMDFAILWI